FGDAAGEHAAPLAEDFSQAPAQRLALLRGLEAEVADQAAAGPTVGRQPPADQVEIAAQPGARREPAGAERLAHQLLHVLEVAVENFDRERFLRSEVVGERAVR